MGVWIEIEITNEKGGQVVVTPLVGVWIEIFSFSPNAFAISVTPLVGVWIEIPLTSILGHNSKSLPLWECGLKLQWNLLMALM